MGYGNYSHKDRSIRAFSSGYYTKPREEIFKQRKVTNEMSPMNLGIRESRDSEEHPNSLAIIIGLDHTGSMGMVPHELIKDGLPNMINKIFQKGISDVQVMFLGIGDHKCDSAPIQVGQFESSDELMDKWLEGVYLEGHGGGNEGESYMLAWYVAAFHTSIDCLEKRGKKGFLITIGDEACHPEIPVIAVRNLFGESCTPYLPPENVIFDSPYLLEKAREKYSVFHINICETSEGARAYTQGSWKEILGGNLRLAESHAQVADIIADTVVKDLGLPPVEEIPESLEIEEPIQEEEEEVIL